MRSPVTVAALFLSVLPTSFAHAGSSKDTALAVCTQPLGPFDKGLLTAAEQGIRYLYGATVSRLPARPLPTRAYYPKRRRYRADTLLDFLASTVVPRSACDIVVGFTRRDISATKGDIYDWGILGYGQVSGTVAVVSSYRMRGTGRQNQMKRAVKVVNHELGHVLGVDHYDEYRPGCLMNDGQGTVKTVDNEHGLLCADSIAIIEKARGLTLPRHANFDWNRVLP